MQRTVTTSFDLFGTLVSADRPADPATAVADALRERDVSVPADWATAYREPQTDVPAGAERSLASHVAAVLDSRGVDAPGSVVEAATLAAFDRPVAVRDGARDAVDAASSTGPVAVLSNCSVPGLVERTLDRTDLADKLDAVVTSVDCGWRKPDPRAFEAVADALGVPTGELVHVGDDREADGGVEAVGGRALLLDDVDLTEIADRLEAGAWD
ncbi:HAD family hydrolase [Halobacterium wangiae]|uniref:HAD family hydrolase n=1 Tax=Halobacterium wangiae TaxID=2902623 RepID=UPI001E53D458|nr:HAD family hydrolase [Halobacterium wangiae]